MVKKTNKLIILIFNKETIHNFKQNNKIKYQIKDNLLINLSKLT